MQAIQKFSIEAVASLATGRLYAAEGAGNGFADMHRLGAFLLGGDCFDFALVQHGDWLAGVVRAQYPDLPPDDVYDPDALKAFPARVSIERPETTPSVGLAAAIAWLSENLGEKCPASEGEHGG